MKSTLAGAALAFALLFAAFPVFAQEKPVAPVCGYYYDSTVDQLTSLANVVIEEIAAADLTAFMARLEEHVGHKFGVVTRAFVMSVKDPDGKLFNKVVGLEMGGCLSDPIKVALDF